MLQVRACAVGSYQLLFAINWAVCCKLGRDLLRVIALVASVLGVRWEFAESWLEVSLEFAGGCVDLKTDFVVVVRLHDYDIGG